MEDLHRMMAEIQEQQRQERELRESYDEQWDYSGTEVCKSGALVPGANSVGMATSTGKKH